MKIMHMSSLRMILCVTVIATLVSGCSIVEYTQVDPTPYLLSETGKVDIFTVAEISTRLVFPIPVNSQHTIFLIPGHPNEVKRADILRALWRSKKSQKISSDEGIARAAAIMVGDSAKSPWWIISTDPDLVIVSGPGEFSSVYHIPRMWRGHVELGSQLSFVTDADQNRRVTCVRIVKDWKTLPNNSMLIAPASEISTYLTSVELNRPQLLGECLNSKVAVYLPAAK